MTLLSEWLATPVRNKKEWDWAELQAAIEAADAVVAAKEKPAVLKAALARLVETEPHIFWQRAQKLKSPLKQELLEIAKRSTQVQCQLYAAVAPKGLATLGRFHSGIEDYDARVRALGKNQEARDEEVVAAARAIIANKKKFMSGLKKLDDALGDEGHNGIIALLMLADDLDGLQPIWEKKWVAKHREFLVLMAKGANAKKILASLRK